MKIKKIFLLFISTAIIADQDNIILKLEDKLIEKILEEDKNIERRSKIKINKNISFLTPVLFLLLSNKLSSSDNQTNFDDIIIESSGLKDSYLTGKVIDIDGIENLIISYDDKTPNEEYKDGIIYNKILHTNGTKVELKVIDNLGNIIKKYMTL